MITLNIADATTLPACLALLPATADSLWRHWAARADGEIVGAGAMRWQTLAQATVPGLPCPPGFTISILVREGWRRRGIGRLLVDALAADAHNESDGLWSADRHTDDTPVAKFLERCGFTARQRDLHYQMTLSGLVSHLEPIVARLRSSGHVPTNSALVRLRDAPLAQVAVLVAANFGQLRQNVLARLQLAMADPIAARINADRSVVAIEGGTVVGAVIGDIIGATARVDCIVVAPNRRGSYVGALQLFNVAQECADIAAHITFHCDSRQFHTTKLATRGGAELALSEARYWRPILP